MKTKTFWMMLLAWITVGSFTAAALSLIAALATQAGWVVRALYLVGYLIYAYGVRFGVASAISEANKP